MLNELQTHTLHALVDRIIPADDYPGGWDAGVGNYLALLLTKEPRFLFVYQSGLDALAADGFPGLNQSSQDALLTRLEAESERGEFFRQLVAHVMEGFYADPGNGGNTDGVSWRMVGYKVTA